MDFETLKASLNNRPFVGYFVNKAGFPASMSDVELISHITDNLYVGGCEPEYLGDFFSHVFSLYKWGAYEVDEGTIVRTWKMYDSHDDVMVMDLDENLVSIDEVADEVVAALHEGGNVLVHCQAGINRSNLTAALALMKWKDMSADEAIALLRSKRSDLVLANRAFEQYLRNLDV